MSEAVASAVQRPVRLCMQCPVCSVGATLEFKRMPKPDFVFFCHACFSVLRIELGVSRATQDDIDALPAKHRAALQRDLAEAVEAAGLARKRYD